jgi:hypothetical protein
MGPLPRALRALQKMAIRREAQFTAAVGIRAAAQLEPQGPQTPAYRPAFFAGRCA